MKCTVAWLGCLTLACAAAYGAVNPADLFEKPVALTDASGKAMITSKGQGCPFAADYNGDGKVDIVLGAKETMDTATGGIWLIPNRGAAGKPVFNWHEAIRVKTSSAPVRVGCG